MGLGSLFKRNKKTGEMIDSRESVLAYFMSLTPKEFIIDSTPNVVTKKLIKDLYEEKKDDIKNYNINNFQIEEIPINMFFSRNKDISETNKKR